MLDPITQFIAVRSMHRPKVDHLPCVLGFLSPEYLQERMNSIQLSRTVEAGRPDHLTATKERLHLRSMLLRREIGARFIRRGESKRRGAHWSISTKVVRGDYGRTRRATIARAISTAAHAGSGASINPRKGCTYSSAPGASLQYTANTWHGVHGRRPSIGNVFSQCANTRCRQIDQYLISTSMIWSNSCR